MGRVEEGESRLTQVCEEGEKLLLHLPKASAAQVQQHLSSIQQDWDGFVEQCRQNQQILEDSASLIRGYAPPRPAHPPCRPTDIRTMTHAGLRDA